MNNSRWTFVIVGFFVLLVLFVSAPTFYLLGFISLSLTWLIFFLALIFGALYIYLTKNKKENHQTELESRSENKLETKNFNRDTSELETIEVPRERSKLKRL